MTIARKVYISGLVQGVGFRFFTQRSAARHQVVGYVKNLKDGRVESYFEGDERSVMEFLKDISAGPTYARVTDVEELVVEPVGGYTAFLIER